MITTVGLFCIVLSFMHFSSASPIRNEEWTVKQIELLTVIRDLILEDFSEHKSDLYYTPNDVEFNEEEDALSCFKNQLRVFKSISKDRKHNKITFKIDSILEFLPHEKSSETDSVCSTWKNEEKQAPVAFLKQLETLLQKRFQRFSKK